MTPAASAPSLAGKLSRTLTLWLCAIWLAASMGMGWHTHREVNDGFDIALTESAERLLDLALHEVEEVRAVAPGAMPPGGLVVATHANLRTTRHTLMYQVTDDAHRLQLRSADAPATPLAPTLAPGFTDSAELRVYTLRHPSAPYTIHVADSHANRRHAVTESMLWMLVPLLGLLPLLAAASYRLARRGLLPVGDLAQQIQARGGNNLQALQSPGLPRELQAIAASTNHLLQRLADALDVERALAANAAHELRTPLAAASLRLRNALDHTPAGPARTELEQALGALDQLARRSEKLLQLSRAGSASALAREPVDLVQLAGAVAQAFWAQPGHQRLQLALPEDGEVLAHGDLDALAIALRNLVENALRYSGDGAQVTLEVSAPATLTVRDSGPGVPAALLESIRQRHVRRAGDQAGFGLGLSIVSDIARRHDGHLSLHSPRRNGQPGFEAVLALQPAS